ncbi:MAG: cytochrome bc complex cytochrome b subunit [Acidimicrobiia bacterium]
MAGLQPKRLIALGRTRAQGVARGAAAKVFPTHWSFLLGEIALVSFVVLVVTGTYLAFFYDASGDTVTYAGSYAPLQGVPMPAAYRSVLDISFDVPAGLLVRQVHHWASLVFIGALVAHALRVFFSGAFRKPRRLNWTIGVTMAAAATANGFFGLGLPGDLLGGTGVRIAYGFATSVPFIGPGLGDVVFGGEFPDPALYHRMWQLHVLVLPAVLAVLLAGHLALVAAQSHTQHAMAHRARHRVAGSRGWPGYALKTAALSAVVVATLVAMGALLQIAPIWLYGPFNAADATVPAQPDWYLAWVEGSLRIVPSLDLRLFGREIPGSFLSGVVLPSAVFTALYAWPYLEAWLTGDHEAHHEAERMRDRPVRSALGVGACSFLGVLVAAAGHDVQGLLLDVPLQQVTRAYRVLVLVVPPVAAALTWKLCRDLAAGDGAADAVDGPVAVGTGAGTDADEAVGEAPVDEADEARVAARGERR